MLRVKIVVSIAILALVAMARVAIAAEEPKAPAEKPAVTELKLAGDKADKENIDPYAVPDSSPKVLVGFITKLISGTPPHDMETLKKLRGAILTAAEKILAGKPDEQDFEFAVKAKMNMLDTPDQLSEFVSELKKDGHEAAARMVRGFMLQIELRKIMTGGKKDVKQPIEDAVKFLEEAPPQISDLTLAFTAGTLAESGEDHELANTTYARLLKIFKSSNDPKLADFTHILEGVVRRLNLVGQPMKLEGKFLDGESLDWTKYSGKVVLVLFWATDYVPCLRDVPIWKSLYEQYHAKDFEILGISLDRNNTELEDFVKAQSIPWPNVISNGKTNSNMIYYGVTNLPTTMLVGKNGKVLAVDLKSEELKKELEQLLGPVVEPSKEKSGK